MAISGSPVSPFQGVAICATSWLCWEVYQRYLAKSPFDNIPGPARTSLVMGNFQELFDRNASDSRQEICDKYGPVLKVHLALGYKTLFLYDARALHSIFVTDQADWEQPSYALEGNKLVFGPGLLSASGDRHRKQRKLLNPAFSTSHMRHLTPIFYSVIHDLRSAIAAQIKDSPKEVDMLSWMSRAALELIGQGGLGYSFDPLVADKPDDFAEAIKELIPSLDGLSVVALLAPCMKMGPPWFRRWLVDRMPIPAVQRAKNIIDIIDNRSREVLREKRAALESGGAIITQQVAEGKDIMSILLRANTQASEEDRLDEDELIAQMSTLVLGAMDTTSNALAQKLQLLAMHPEIQEKLREEVTAARNGHDIPYDELIELPYLDAVCREALRLYAPAAVASRQAVVDTKLPLSQPIRGVDGTLIHEIPVPKDTLIIIGNHASNVDKAVWGDDANEFKPERWLSALPPNATHIPGVYSNMMTFSGGHRACIGYRFSLLEMKVVLSILLESFKFSPPNEEIVWNVASIRYPTVGKDGTKPSMPMKVELIK